MGTLRDLHESDWVGLLQDTLVTKAHRSKHGNESNYGNHSYLRNIQSPRKTLTSLAPFGRVNSQILAKAPQMLRYAYIS